MKHFALVTTLSLLTTMPAWIYGVENEFIPRWTGFLYAFGLAYFISIVCKKLHYRKPAPPELPTASTEEEITALIQSVVKTQKAAQESYIVWWDYLVQRERRDRIVRRLHSHSRRTRLYRPQLHKCSKPIRNVK